MVDGELVFNPSGTYTISFKSEVLKARTNVIITIPKNNQAEATGQSYPVLYLLHGGGDLQADWIRFSNAQRYASDYGFITIMPAVFVSFYMDMIYGRKYFTYLAEELVPLMDQLLPISKGKENHMIAGFSMGGMGAFKLGTYLNDYFSYVGTFCGPIDWLQSFQDSIDGIAPGGPDMIYACGSREIVEREPNNTFAMLERLKNEGKELPKYYQEVGTEDFTYRDNERSHRRLMELGVESCYCTRHGTHNWAFWDTALQNFLNYACPNGPIETSTIERSALLPHPAYDIKAYYTSTFLRCEVMWRAFIPSEKHGEISSESVLIHPSDEDGSYWMRHYDLEAISEVHKTIMLCPDVYDSNGYDPKIGRPFGSFIREELPQVLSGYFLQGRELPRSYLYKAEFDALFKQI
ncbi:MAG: hypothetical protein IJJ67_05180 [Oscillospiraceae bacterium]|nr:hypothetical protein [Oscillospiraceae bacterium]